MPAPKFLSRLPKPVLFGLYGAVGGLLGALVFAEPLYRILTPPPPPPKPAPEARVAIAASPEVQVFVDGRNTFPVLIDRGGFDGPVTVRFEGLPAGVTANKLTIPANETKATALVLGARDAKVATLPIKAIAEATHDGKTVSASTEIAFKVFDPPRPRADVVFVLDVTSSMQWAIDDLRNGIGKFAESMEKARIDFRLGLVTFKDETLGEKTEVALFKGEPFTADPAVFRDKVAELRASGGGDIPESSLEGITKATALPFRPEATKLLLLITDAPPKVVPEAQTAAAVNEAAERVRDKKIDAVHTVVERFDKDVYQPLRAAGADKGGGKYFNLGDVVREEEGFNDLLTSFGTVVSEAAIAKNPEGKPRVSAEAEKPTLPGLKSLQSGEQSAAGTEKQLVLRSGIWTAAIAALVCLFLLSGQQHYLRGSLPSVGGVAAGFLGGLVVGLVGGAAGQGVYLFAPDNVTLARIFQGLGWALLGGLAGAGLSLFVPNMKWTLGLTGGAIGGAAGAIGFIVVSSYTGDLVGRLVGGLVLGFCIGLMVAVAEVAFRRAWLEVRFGGRETITVTLGPEPVKVGSDAKVCTVWARGAPAVAVRYSVRDGTVICDDAVNKRETAVGDGFEKEVGNVTVTVRTGSSSTAAVPTAARPVAKPAKPAAISLDEDDGFDLPMPVSPNRPAAASAPKPAPMAERPAPLAKPAVPARPPIPATGSKPVMPPTPAVPGPTPPVPPVTPAIKPTVKDPNACPGCGRVVAGRPGQRYCMVCDHTY
jgi:Mg-chelatase subunit ChlD